MDAIQFYAPPDGKAIVIEPRVNLADSYNPIWGKTDTGMASWQPSYSLAWPVRLELFTPAKN
jgi:aldose 1-epimerase